MSLQYNGVTGCLGASMLSWSVTKVLNKITERIKSMKNYITIHVVGLGALVSTAVLLEDAARCGV